MAFAFREEEDGEEEEETGEEPEEEEEEGPAETLIRHRHSMDNVASSSYPWNFTEEESSGAPGMKPSDLYGKFTWKIENFSQISKRELRSNLFEVGGCKWYILVYPQGCDVCNHLSLFLCVADYDKLLPGWSHFAQFTIAVVNKNPKKSKYSDTLHRFCKKEHDWGWKKFMELSKVLDGFTVAETLVIKAQVQVIREDPDRPFRCLDYQYRRELVRVYLTNVEAICRRFVEEKREKIGKLIEDSVGWSSFQTFWSAVEGSMRRRLSRERVDIILKLIVKCFFNQKEVTSPLVIDALYSGYRALDYQSKNRKGKVSAVEMEQAQKPIVWVDKDFFVLADDVLLLLERALNESLPFYKGEKGPQNRTKDACSGDGSGKDNLEQDERRLTELGRRTVEMFVLGHLFSNRIEVAYLEAIALKRQEELIREEEAAEQAEIELKARREVAEKEKRNKKKQAKQRRNDRKEKDKILEAKHVGVQEPMQRDGSTSRRATVSSLSKGTSIMGDNEDDDSTILVDVGGVVSMLRPATEDGEVDQLIWEREASEMEATFSGASCLDFVSTDRTNRRHEGFLDDSSSTCSSDSILSLCDASNGPGWKRSNTNLGDLSQTSASRSRGRVLSDMKSRQGETGVSKGHLAILEHTHNSCNCNCDPETEAAFPSLKKHAQSRQHSLSEKKQLSYCRRQVGTNEDGQEGGDIWNKADSDIRVREKTKVLLKNIDKLRDNIPSTLGNDVDKMTPNAIIELTPGDGINTSNDAVKSKGRLINCSSMNAMETIESVSNAHFPSASSTNSVDTQSSRPSSAPDQPTTSRTAPVVNQQSPLPSQSARCMGALDRLGVTATDFTSSSSMCQGSAVISYSSGTLNIIGNNSLLATSNTPFSQAESALRTNDLLSSSVEQSDFPANQLLVESAKGKSASEQIACKGGQPELQESSIGFTFGTVTPELLHSDQQQENQVNHHADDGYRSESQFPLQETPFGTVTPELLHSDQQQGNQVHHHADDRYHSESQFPSLETRGNLLLDDHSTDSLSNEHNMGLTPSECERILSLHITSSPVVEHQRILSHYIASSPSSEQHQSSLSQHFISSSAYEQQRSLPQNITSASSNEHHRNLSQRMTYSPSNKHQSNLSQYITTSLLNEQQRSESQHITCLSSSKHQRNLSQHISYSSSNPHLSHHNTSSLLDEHQSDPSQYITSSCSNQHQGSSSQHHMARHFGSEEASVSCATMSEEFPHLDIINELLDEDKFLQHDANVYSPTLPSYALYHGRIYAHSLGMRMNVHQAERGDNREPHLDRCTTFPQFSNALDGDHMHLQHPYSHSPLHHSISSPCGVIESMPEYHWQNSQEDLSNRFRNDMNMLIGYPIQTHLLIPDCPPYTLGQNGYPIYSPIKYP